MTGTHRHDESYAERMRRAYDKHEARFLAMPASDLLTINIDVPAVFTLSLAKLAQLGPLYAEVRTLRRLDQELVGHVEEYLLALGQAHARYGALLLPRSKLSADFKVLLKARGDLAGSLRELARHGLLGGSRAHQFKWPTSRRNVVFDVLGMVGTFRAHWHEVQHRTPVTEQALQEAEEHAQRVLSSLGTRPSKDVLARARHIRMAALTLFARAWDQLRRGVHYLRWMEGDADTLTPSIYVRRRTSLKL